MQKGNEPKNVVLLGFLKDLAAVTGNDPPLQCCAGQARLRQASARRGEPGFLNAECGYD
jgi:hypothetical protein